MGLDATEILGTAETLEEMDSRIKQNIVRPEILKKKIWKGYKISFFCTLHH